LSCCFIQGISIHAIWRSLLRFAFRIGATCLSCECIKGMSKQIGLNVNAYVKVRIDVRVSL
jgi:hypothetical protein